MELYVYNPAMERIGVIEEIDSLIWKRNYQTVGELNLMVPYRDDYAALLVDGNLLKKAHGNEAMQIGYHSNSQAEQNGEQIEVHGRTLMSWLERRVILSQIISSEQTGQQIIRKMLTQNITAPTNTLRRIPLTALYARDDYSDEAIPTIKARHTEGY